MDDVGRRWVTLGDAVRRWPTLADAGRRWACMWGDAGHVGRRWPTLGNTRHVGYVGRHWAHGVMLGMWGNPRICFMALKMPPTTSHMWRRSDRVALRRLGGVVAIGWRRGDRVASRRS
eukprot:5901766-Prymnesium_polylepis.1